MTAKTSLATARSWCDDNWLFVDMTVGGHWSNQRFNLLKFVCYGSQIE